MTTGLDRIAELQPEATAKLLAARQLAPTVTDPALLSLCCDYVDTVLSGKPWRPPPLTPREQVFLAFTEQFMVSVSSMTEQQVTALLDYATADEVYSFINALFVMEMTRRIQLVSEVVLE